MTEDEIKEELGLHLAKSILTQSATARETVARVVVTVCTISIPSYLALLNVFSSRLTTTAPWLKLAPFFTWLVALLLVSSVIFPVPAKVDFKQPQQLIEEHGKRIKQARSIGMVAFSFSLIGIIWMSVIILQK